MKNGLKGSHPQSHGRCGKPREQVSNRSLTDCRQSVTLKSSSKLPSVVNMFSDNDQRLFVYLVLQESAIQ